MSERSHEEEEEDSTIMLVEESEEWRLDSYGYGTSLDPEESEKRVYLNEDCWKTIISTGFKFNGPVSITNGFGWSLGTLLALTSTSKHMAEFASSEFWGPLIRDWGSYDKFVPGRVPNALANYLTRGFEFCNCCLTLWPCDNAKHTGAIMGVPTMPFGPPRSFVDETSDVIGGISDILGFINPTNISYVNPYKIGVTRPMSWEYLHRSPADPSGAWIKGSNWKSPFSVYHLFSTHFDKLNGSLFEHEILEFYVPKALNNNINWFFREVNDEKSKSRKESEERKKKRCEWKRKTERLEECVRGKSDLLYVMHFSSV